HAIAARVIDLRWLNPIAFDAVRAAAAETGSVLVVDECRHTGGGVADAIIADLAEQGIGRRLGSVRSVDSFVPLGPASAAVLIGVDQVIAGALAAVGERTLS
ncbi:MAG TPA: transketolase C-terminal domain-containing protein, partial [Candidatus Limnocylindria bacterium]|nr:transketolase C-terminal domain-containing protein [Candidatus Limnocylindria bacterium]